MYTKNELRAAKLLGIDPERVKGYEDDPELRDLIPELITLQRNKNLRNEEISKLPPPAPGGKTPEEVLREVRQEVWDSLTFGRLQGETLRLRAKTS